MLKVIKLDLSTKVAILSICYFYMALAFQSLFVQICLEYQLNLNNPTIPSTKYFYS